MKGGYYHLDNVNKHMHELLFLSTVFPRYSDLSRSYPYLLFSLILSSKLSLGQKKLEYNNSLGSDQYSLLRV